MRPKDERRPLSRRNFQWVNERSARGALIEHGGLRMRVADWAKYLGITPQAIHLRARQVGIEAAIAMGGGRKTRKKTQGGR